MRTRICKTCGWWDNDDEFLEENRCPYCSSEDTALKKDMTEPIPRIGFEPEVKV